MLHKEGQGEEKKSLNFPICRNDDDPAGSRLAHLTETVVIMDNKNVS